MAFGLPLQIQFFQPHALGGIATGLMASCGDDDHQRRHSGCIGGFAVAFGNVSIPFCPRPASTRVFGSGRHYSTAATVIGALSEDYHCLRWEFETLLGGAQMWPTFNQLIAAATGRSDYG
jgi:hypothetical protein